MGSGGAVVYGMGSWSRLYMHALPAGANEQLDYSGKGNTFSDASSHKDDIYKWASSTFTSGEQAVLDFSAIILLSA